MGKKTRDPSEDRARRDCERAMDGLPLVVRFRIVEGLLGDLYEENDKALSHELGLD